MTEFKAADLPSPDDCERIFHAALADGDTRGVEAALTVMAVQDPHRAEDLLNLTRLALTITAATEGNT